MFKSLFSKRNRNDPPAAQNDSENPLSRGTTASSENFAPDQPLNFPLNEVLTQLYESLDPSDSDGYPVAVAEVEYLWARYKQLCGGNKTVNDEILIQEPFKSKPFLRQVWKTIPRDPNGDLTFPALFGVLKWWEAVDQDTKLRGIFKLLNSGQPLDIAALTHVIKALDGSVHEDLVNRKAVVLMTHLDDKNQGHIDEEQWVRGIKTTLSDEEINHLTNVYILPQPSPHLTSNTQSHGSPVSVDVLVTISSVIGKNNWKHLALELGFNDTEIKGLEKHFPNRSIEQVYQMLKHWREREGSTKEVLELALRTCGMDDALSVLQSE